MSVTCARGVCVVLDEDREPHWRAGIPTVNAFAFGRDDATQAQVNARLRSYIRYHRLTPIEDSYTNPIAAGGQHTASMLCEVPADWPHEKMPDPADPANEATWAKWAAEQDDP